jgi:hypothetical protein
MATKTELAAPPQWVVDLNAPQAPKSKSSSLPDPPGFTSATIRVCLPHLPSNDTTLTKIIQKDKSSKSQTPARKPPSTAEVDTLKLKKAWELAIAPAKQLPMSAIGMYMSGNSLQIFSIMMVFMLFKTPITAVMNIQSTFARLETDGTRDKMWQVKVVYVLCNMLALALGVWKVNKMGLLPYVCPMMFMRIRC